MTPVARPAFVAMKPAGEPTRPRSAGFASRPPNEGARSVEWTSSACSVANDAYSGRSIAGRCAGGEGEYTEIRKAGADAFGGSSSGATVVLIGCPVSARHIRAARTTVSTARTDMRIL